MALKSRFGQVFSGLGLFLAAISLSSCASPLPLEITQALQKLQDSGNPCDFPLFFDFETVLESDQQVFCRNSEGSHSGYKMTFFPSRTDFEASLDALCKGPAGPAVRTPARSTELISGENWVATSSSGATLSLVDLKSVLGGKISTLENLCD